jgi:hypothetical protein
MWLLAVWLRRRLHVLRRGRLSGCSCPQGCGPRWRGRGGCRSGLRYRRRRRGLRWGGRRGRRSGFDHRRRSHSREQRLWPQGLRPRGRCRERLHAHRRRGRDEGHAAQHGAASDDHDRGSRDHELQQRRRRAAIACKLFLPGVRDGRGSFGARFRLVLGQFRRLGCHGGDSVQGIAVLASAFRVSRQRGAVRSEQLTPAGAER